MTPTVDQVDDHRDQTAPQRAGGDGRMNEWKNCQRRRQVRHLFPATRDERCRSRALRVARYPLSTTSSGERVLKTT